MIVAVVAALLVGVGVVGVAPLLLARGAWRLRAPQLALIAWLAVFASGGVLLLSSIGLAVLAVTTAARSTEGWLAAVALTMFGWIGLACVGAVGALAAARNEQFAAARLRSSHAVTLLTAATAYRWDELRGVEVCYVDAGGFAAVAIRTDGPRIIVGRTFADSLAPAELRAVLEHERAHLVGWHDRILRLAQLNRACFPVLRGARSFDQTVHLLIELVADDAAARRCGAATCGSALRKLAAFSGDEASALRAQRLAISSRSSARRGRRAAARPAAS